MTKIQEKYRNLRIAFDFTSVNRELGNGLGKTLQRCECHSDKQLESFQSSDFKVKSQHFALSVTDLRLRNTQ